MSILVKYYWLALHHHPLQTTAVSSLVCYFSGDILAQTIEIKLKKRQHLDWHRLLVYSGFALAVAGPLYHMWFNHLHQMPVLIKKIMETQGAIILVIYLITIVLCGFIAKKKKK